jgi:hypothetical protein
MLAGKPNTACAPNVGQYTSEATMEQIRAVVVQPNVSGRLVVQHVEAPAPWTEIADVAHHLFNRPIAGKAVLLF